MTASGETSRNREANIREALRWIAGMLESLHLPYQVAGGLAAIAYGSDRPLHDIDIYLPEGTLQVLLPRVDEHRTEGPRRVRSEHWDCLFLTVRYAGERIELADAARTRYRASVGRPWHDAEVDFQNAVHREVFGVTLPVMPREDLIAYKRRLGRDVDLADLEGIERRR